jgi:riboflavin kinase/FMN adenylyltransferase
MIYIPFNETVSAISAENFITDIIQKKMNTAYFLCGSDFRFGKERAGDVALLQSMCPDFGCTVEIEDDFVLDGERVSSTAVAECIIKGDFEKPPTHFIRNTSCSQGYTCALRNAHPFAPRTFVKITHGN